MELKTKNHGAGPKLLNIFLILVTLLPSTRIPIYLHFFSFFPKFLPPGSRSRREHECGSMRIRIHSPEILHPTFCRNYLGMQIRVTFTLDVCDSQHYSKTMNEEV